MGPISRWAVKRPLAAFAVWLVMAVVIAGSWWQFRGEYNDSFELPGTDSSEAQELLEQIPEAGSAGFDDIEATVLWKVDSGSIQDEDNAATAEKYLQRLSEVKDAACVVTPLGMPIGKECPAEIVEEAEMQAQMAEAAAIAEEGGVLSQEQQQMLQAAQQQQEQIEQMRESAQRAVQGLRGAGVSQDGTIGKATLTFTSNDNSAEIAPEVFDIIEDFRGEDGFTVGAEAQQLEFAGQEAPTSEIYGIAIALIILVLVFGSLLAGLLPIIASALSVAVGSMVVGLIAAGVDVATFAPMLATMIGLGVGIDYALFVISRFQQDIADGRSPKQAALESVESAGRAVVFAAFTVIIALLGLMATGVNFFTGLALAAASTVFFMMIGATFVLPAFLSLAGMRTFAWRLGMKSKVMKHHDHGIFAKYGQWLHGNYKWLGPIALLLLVVVAWPVQDIRLGFPDASGKAEDSRARVAYELVSEGFSPGLNGPFLVTVDGSSNDSEEVQELAATIQDLDGVDAALAPQIDAEGVGMIQVIPSSGPQAEETRDLLTTLRDDVAPDFESSNANVNMLVGGISAVESDFSKVLADALPGFLALVVGLGFLILMLLFRSILVPLVGAATSLLSLAAAMGVVVAVFQWGWFNELLNIPGTGPIMPFVPIMVFAILFGLSMDYQVFLVSRMQEEWEKTHRNTFSVLQGLASSGRVVAIAAAIMCGVFGSFIFEDMDEIKIFGVALTAAVLFDAFIIRLIIVPALMFTFGKANWWLPQPLAKVLPKFNVEGSSDSESAHAAESDHQREDETLAHVGGASQVGANPSKTHEVTPEGTNRSQSRRSFGPPESRPKPFTAAPVKVPQNPKSALAQTAAARQSATLPQALAVGAIAAIAIAVLALSGDTTRAREAREAAKQPASRRSGREARREARRAAKLDGNPQSRRQRDEDDVDHHRKPRRRR